MNYYGVTRSTDHLAHYGVKGMKWGVRKAIARGNERALNRHFRKAAKKLAKLQDIGLHSGKYAAKAAGYGAAALGMGNVTLGGTKFAGNVANKVGSKVAKTYAKVMPHTKETYDKYLRMRSGTAGEGIKDWGKKAAIERKWEEFIDKNGNVTTNRRDAVRKVTKKGTVLSNDALYRIGTGAIAAGLAAKAAQNAYRAKNGAKYRQRASDFKQEMDAAFKGTRYEGRYIVPPRRKKKRR